jgi:microcystin-dependent protein
MTKVLFKRKTSDEIATLPVEDGALIYNYETGATYLDYDDERIPTGGGMPTGDTFPIGAITSYAGSTAPTNWLICDGRAISRVTYSDLFNAIGTTYGSGDGNTTFNLPNLKGRVVVGKDTLQTEFDTLGEIGGEKTHILTVDEIPSHYHDIYVDETGTGGIWGPMSTQQQSLQRNAITGNTGGGEAHNILQPYITLNYIIKAFQSVGTVANVVNITTDSDEDTYNCNYINRKLDTLLYSNDEGSNGNITLNESVENFEHVKVVWSVNKQYFSTIEIYNPNNKSFYLNINTQNDCTRCWSQPNTFNGNVITRGTASYQNINGELNNANLIYIHKVVGCGRI